MDTGLSMTKCYLIIVILEIRGFLGAGKIFGLKPRNIQGSSIKVLSFIRFWMIKGKFKDHLMQDIARKIVGVRTRTCFNTDVYMRILSSVDHDNCETQKQ